MLKVFIDGSGWNSIINPNFEYHQQGKEYFQQLLDSKAKIYTNILEVNKAIYQIKNERDSQTAQDFSRLIDEAVLKSDISLELNHWSISFLISILKPLNSPSFKGSKYLSVSLFNCSFTASKWGS